MSTPLATVAMEVAWNDDRMQKSNWSDSADFLRLLRRQLRRCRATSQVRIEDVVRRFLYFSRIPAACHGKARGENHTFCLASLVWLWCDSVAYV